MPSERFEDAVPSKFLQTCDIPVKNFAVAPFTMVIFGGTGDLSRRKLLPTLFYLFQEGELSGAFSILAVARSPMEEDRYRDLVREAVRGGETPTKWEEFSRRLFYLPGDWETPADYSRLCAKVGQIAPESSEPPNIIYYMALPPETTPRVVQNLEENGLCRGSWKTKILVEKPFGRDFSSARKLNQLLTRSFGEDRIYRIDHYLGKETVQNIIFFRFGNGIFEQLWNRYFIDNVQITVAEEIGIENRGNFYEQSGVVRDIAQNHLLQIMGLIAMEPPIGFEAEFIRDEKNKVFQSIHPINEDWIRRFGVRGQYGAGPAKGPVLPPYRQEKDVGPASIVPTFFAAKLQVANWRWAGVPFFVRTGKRLARQVTEVAIAFRQPPLKLFGRSCDALDPNVLVLTIQPEEEISLRFGVKYPGVPNQIHPVRMNFNYREAFRVKEHPAYARLLIDCLKGDLTLFVREDAIEAMWQIVDPFLDYWDHLPPEDFPNYPAGSWGPPEAGRLLAQEGRRWITE